MSRNISALGKPLLCATAALDVLWRTFPELVGVGDTVVLPAVLVVTSNLVLDAAAVGWGLGWLLLGLVVFTSVPRLYPDDVEDVASGVPLRLAAAVTAVAVGTLVERSIVEEWFGVGTTPIPYGLERLGVVLAGGTLLFVAAVAVSAVARRGSDDRPRTSELDPWEEGGSPTISWRTDSGSGALDPFSSGRGSAEPRRSTLQASEAIDFSLSRTSGVGAAELVWRSVVLSACLGLLLAAISLLYPVSELIVIGWFASDLVDAALGSGAEIPARADLAERFAVGASSVWGSAAGVYSFLYVCVGLFAHLVVLFYVRLLLGDVWSANAGSLLFAFVCLGAATIHAAAYWLRISERLPVALFDIPHSALVRVPGLLLPSGLLLAVFIAWNNTVPGEPLPDAVPLGYLVAAVVGVAVALGTVLLSDVVDDDPSFRADHALIPVAIGCHLALPAMMVPDVIAGFGTIVTSEPLATGAILRGVGRALAVMGLAVCPYFVPHALLIASDAGWGGLGGLLGTYALALAAWIVTLVLFLVVGPENLGVGETLLPAAVIVLSVGAVVHTAYYLVTRAL